ncbi:MAG: class I SAM-dependent methyltransferase [Clostridia bacterium]|nr:class I SAM-dependent methyltransferase [Clostridia bacterium]
MNNQLWEHIKSEEACAQIHGWDFSHIDGRYEEENDIPWDYKAEILKRLTPDMTILDIDTGGGEFLLSLQHPYENTCAMEGYKPNAALCEKTLAPLGIRFREGNAARIPFEDESIDMVINRHGDFDAEEISRVLKKDGLFITQQVGAYNDRELVNLLLDKNAPVPFPEQTLEKAKKKFEDAGFSVLNAKEHFGCIRFYEIGALVWFARIIEWEFVGFSVDRYLSQIENAQRQIEKEGSVSGRTHRFFLVCQKG